MPAEKAFLANGDRKPAPLLIQPNTKIHPRTPLRNCRFLDNRPTSPEAMKFLS